MFPLCSSSSLIPFRLPCAESLGTLVDPNEEEVVNGVPSAVAPPPQTEPPAASSTPAAEPATVEKAAVKAEVAVQTEADTKNTEGGQKFYAATQKAKRGLFLGRIANTKIPLWVPDLLFKNGQTDEDLARELIQNNIKELKNVTFNVKKVKTSWYELLLVKATEQNYRYFKIEGIEGLKVAEPQFFLEQISNGLEIREYCLHVKQKTAIQKIVEPLNVNKTELNDS